MADTLNFRIEGGKKLSGTIQTQRSKNGAVGLLCASLLNRGTTTLKNTPKIEEVHRLIEVLQSIGVTAEWHGDDLTLTPPTRFNLVELDSVAAKKTRSILMFIGPLVHELKSFSIPQSGGCKLGSRTVRPHLYALENFGITIDTKEDAYVVSHSGLHPAEVVMYESGDTATINAILAAARIPGTSVIKYASPNYQVQDVCVFLKTLV